MVALAGLQLGKAFLTDDAEIAAASSHLSPVEPQQAERDSRCADRRANRRCGRHSGRQPHRNAEAEPPDSLLTADMDARSAARWTPTTAPRRRG